MWALSARESNPRNVPAESSSKMTLAQPAMLPRLLRLLLHSEGDPETHGSVAPNPTPVAQ